MLLPHSLVAPGFNAATVMTPWITPNSGERITHARKLQ